MGESCSKSKQQETVPIQSYIDHVTEKSRKLWQNDNFSETLNKNTVTKASKPINYPKKHKKSFLDFFMLCTYKEQRPDHFDPNEVII